MSSVLSSPTASKVVAICPKIPAALSMLCSGYIVYSILRDHQKRAVGKERIVLGMSLSDIVFSFFWFLGTWPIPRGSEYVYGAVGNTQTCTMQGFFIQFGITTPMYNGFLAVYCYIYVCLNWSRQRLKYTELLGHICIFVFGLSVAIAGIPLELYNNSFSHCLSAPLPFNCTQSFQSMDGTTDCIRGDNAIIYRWAFFYGVIWINIFLSFISMTLVYLHIRKQEKMMEAYTSDYADSDNNGSARRKANSDSRAFAVRGALFTGSFLLTWVPMTLSATIFTTGNLFAFKRHRLLGLVTMMMVGSQGIVNFFIYAWPSIRSQRKERKVKRQNNNDDELHHIDEQAIRSVEHTSVFKNEEYSGEEKEDE